MHTSRRTLIQGLLIGTTSIAAGAWAAIPANKHDRVPADADAKTGGEKLPNGAPPLIQTAIKPRWPSPFGYAMSSLASG
jgi:hypothetical protein